MAQNEEKIEVICIRRLEDGTIIQKQCFLNEISEEERQDIQGLVILPKVKTNGEDYASVSFTKYIHDFPMLQVITCPQQWQNIPVSTIQRKNCPNLRNIIRTTSNGVDPSNDLKIRAKYTTINNGKKEGIVEVVSHFAQSGGQTPVQFFEVPQAQVKKSSVDNGKVFANKLDIENALKQTIIENKLSAIEEKVGKVASLEEIEQIIGKFAGKITTEQLQMVVNAISNINVFVDDSALVGVVQKTIEEQMTLIAEQDNETYKENIANLLKVVEDLKSKGATEEQLLAYLNEQIPQVIASNNQLTTKVLLGLDKQDEMSESISAVNNSLDIYAGDILGGIADLSSQLSGLATVEDEKKIVEIAMQLVAEQTETLVREKDNEFFDDIKSKLSGVATSTALKKIEDKIDTMPSKTVILNKFADIKREFADVSKVSQEQLDRIISSLDSISLDNEQVVDQVIAEIKAEFETNRFQQQKTLTDAVAELRKIALEAGTKTEAEVKKLFRDFAESRLPDLIATNRKLTDKLMPAIARMEGKVDDLSDKVDDLNLTTSEILEKADNLEVGNNLLLEGVDDLQKDLSKLINNGSNLSEEERTNLSKLINTYVSDLHDRVKAGQTEILDNMKDSFSKVVTAEQIEKIVENKVETLVASLNNLRTDVNENSDIIAYLVRILSGAVLKSLGDLSKLHSEDTKSIKEAIDKIFDSNKFTENMTAILNNSTLAKASSIEELTKLINTQNEAEVKSLSDIASSISHLPTIDKIKEVVRDESSGIYSLLLRRLGLSQNIDDDTLADMLDDNFGFLNGKVKGMEKTLNAILTESKNKGMTIEDLKKYFSSQEGKQVISSALNVQMLTQQLTKIEQANEVRIAELQRAYEANIQLLSRMAANSINIYTGAYGLASGVIQGGGVIPSGYSAQMLQPYLYAYPVSTSTPQEMMTVMQQQILNLYTVLGLRLNPTPNPVDTKDDLKKQLEEFRKEQEEFRKTLQEELRKQQEEFKKQQEEINKKILDRLDQLEQKNKSSEEKDKKKEEENNKKVVPAKVDPVIKNVPKEDNLKFATKCLEKMDRLAEPKLTVVQRFRKWLKRHPLAWTAIGIGAGAILGAGVGVFAAGGIAPFIANMAYFGQSLQTIAAGAGIGLGVGGIGEIIARVTGLGKKDRLYKKFLKRKAKCEKSRGKIEELDRQIEYAKEAINQTREVAKACVKAKQRKRVVKATRKKVKKLRKLRAKARVSKAKYKGVVEDFMQAKNNLNDYEEKKGKTMAMQGNLEKVRKAKAILESKLASATTEEEKEEAQEEFDDALMEYGVGIDGDISKLSDEFKTGDKEVEDIIMSVQGTKTKAMEDMLADIQKRNSKAVDKEHEIKYYDMAKVRDYEKVVNAKGNEADKEQLKEILENAEKTNREARKQAEEFKGSSYAEKILEKIKDPKPAEVKPAGVNPMSTPTAKSTEAKIATSEEKQTQIESIMNYVYGAGKQSGENSTKVEDPSKKEEKKQEETAVSNQDHTR